ncbi:ATP-dependent Clp protease proteolytic subunit [Streptomyces sp. NPDC086838]|uniref:ATP-dependent Clp protease proteolytic subunit n=1 Tax=Streptomyces sp. NPDC086838 TaxID=3365762 RepID=UPI0038133871
MHRPAVARHVLPEFTERTSRGSRTLDPYSKLLGDRIVFLGTALDETAANDLVAQLMYLEYDAPDRPVSLYINSPGGSFGAMTALYDTMAFLSCEVETYCLGRAGAGAAVLLAAGAPGRRYMLPGATVVLSQPALDEPVQGQPSDLEIEARELARMRGTMTGMLARHTGRSVEQITEDTERDLVLDAEGAVAHGIVDHVVRSRVPAPPYSAR